MAEKVVNMTDAQVQSKEVDTPEIQAKGSSGGMEVPAGFESGLNSIKGTGVPINKQFREGMESRMGAYFGDVRIHTGNRADKLARSINAEAFTAGHDIVFAARNGRNFESREGKKLLGHELTHVLQQRKGVQRTERVQRKKASEIYDEYIKTLEGNEFPTKVLKFGKRGKIKFGDKKDSFNPFFNTLYFTHKTLKENNIPIGVEGIKPYTSPNGKKFWRVGGGYSAAVGAFYHECTHSLLDWLEDEGIGDRHTEKWKKYYIDAPMQNGTTSRDHEVLYTEAAAGYAGSKGGALWQAVALVKLAIISRRNGRKEQVKKLMKRSRDIYEKAMELKAFGYEYQWGDEVFTTRPINKDLKAFVDLHVFENKAPDEYDNIPLIKKLRSRYKI
ncbi:MAG: DUF4157 domain-containing protein [bacterium]|nr:DUF4157 domain-containing protein [bacterium]